MTDLPRRIQRKRTKGWKLPAGAVIVTRPTKWGNPFKVGSSLTPNQRCAVAYFEMWLSGRDFLQIGQSGAEGLQLAAEARAELRGNDLACFCPIGEACHADVLLEVANQE